MNRYYIYHPRDFANEYTLLASDDADLDAWIKRAYPTARRLARPRALRLAATKAYDANIPLPLALVLHTRELQQIHADADAMNTAFADL